MESPKSWNSMSYFFLKTTLLHLKHSLQIYLTLLSTDLWFGKWHEEYGKFSAEHLKGSKLGFWWDCFNPKLKNDEIKIQRGVICHDNEEWRKVWRGIDLSFQSWHEEFNEFWPKHLKVSKIFISIDSFWPKYVLFELKKYRRVIFHNRDTKFAEESTCRFKIGIRNLTNFDLSTRKPL